ncbi:hypothetical protein [Micromonospora sp. NPDC005172]|uniref:hypothetical protein n=1 Tax=Micromonospora sp. NPDC005172 TaxID=3156867 RepID=UPI0033A01398
MSISSYLVCPSRKLIIGLGKRLRDESGAVKGFSVGGKFLAETAGAELVIKFSDDPEFDEIAGYREIGGDEYGDITFDECMRAEV